MSTAQREGKDLVIFIKSEGPPEGAYAVFAPFNKGWALGI